MRLLLCSQQPIQTSSLSKISVSLANSSNPMSILLFPLRKTPLNFSYLSQMKNLVFGLTQVPMKNLAQMVWMEFVAKQISSKVSDNYNDFDKESILDEEIEDGVIDSIMGNLSVHNEESITCFNGGIRPVSFCYGYPVRLGLGFGGNFDFDFGFGFMRGGLAKAFRQSDEGDWWRFPTVDVGEISPAEKKKKIEKLNPKPLSIVKKENSLQVSKSSSSSSKENSVPNSKTSPGVLLKLNFECMV